MTTLQEPDLSLTLTPQPRAPRMARQAVGQVDHQSADLRDAVGLLVSNLVSRACRAAPDGSVEEIELRAWMPPSVVRVEVGAGEDGPAAERPDRHLREYDVDLLEGVADRWGIEHPGRGPLMWFEIDRRVEA